VSQNFKNHAKTVPLFHYVAGPIFIFYTIWTIVRMVRYFSAENVVSALVAIALLILSFEARLFALRVQDRVIRLEMRLRMREVLPADLQTRIPDFTVSQLIALRFAGDAELPGLARKVLEEKLNDRTAIKKMVQNWEPDTLRA
jgi:Family of unknown function (DUF6526)